MPHPNLAIPREPVATFCQKWGVVELALFGSVLRDDFGADSDIDVLVVLDRSALLDLGDWTTMIDELRTIFGRDVDLVSRDGLRNPFRRREILRNHEVIYRAA